MSGIWHGSDGKRCSYVAPDLVSRHGKPCPNVFLTRPGDRSSITDCPGIQIEVNGAPFCAECEARKKRNSKP
jgi:hypothetical protein